MKAAKNPGAAVRWAAWLSTNEVEAALQTGDLAFVRPSSAEDPRIKEKYPYITECSEVLKRCYAEATFDIPEATELWEIAMKYAQASFSQKMKPIDACDQIQKEWETKLKHYYT
jgi:ABC-type glycerol-3-phosphate transport system substrate-binding protein